MRDIITKNVGQLQSAHIRIEVYYEEQFRSFIFAPPGILYT